MSKYLEIKAQIEELQSQLEKVRNEELDVEIRDMKKRIIAFGIRPDALFSAEDLREFRPARPSRPRSSRSSAINPRPIKYSYNGNTWTGQGGTPNWYKDALAAGISEDDMRVKLPG